MPAVRLTRARRKSSHTLFTPAKPGVYGIQARPVTFAPNVTPVTYVEPDDDDLLPFPGSPEAASPSGALFPPSETPAPPPARKRCPPGKRRSQGYIPRPPNAFMLFRADFVRQKHVPGSIETNHGSLSKIIGNCWRQLPLDQKRVWEVKAKQEKANHKAMFPNYRFRPVHNKNKNRDPSNPGASSSSAPKKEKPQQTVEEELRCDQVAALLLHGMKGEELARAVRSLDRDREREETAEAAAEASARGSFSHGQHNLSASQSPYDSPVPQAYMPLTLSHPQAQYPTASSSLLGYRRSSSVPLPNDWYPAAFGANPFLPRASFSSMGLGFPSSSSSSSPFVPSSLNPNTSSNTIALPSVPYISHSATHSRAPSPVHGISHAQRQMLGHRRASSAQPVGFNMFAGRRSWTMPAYGSSAFNGYVGTGMNGVGMNGMSMNPFFGYDAYDASMGYDASLGMGGMSAPLERDDEPLPEVDGSLFTTDFSFSSSSSSNPAADSTSAQAGSPPHDPSTTPPSIAPHALPALDLDSARLGWGEASLASASSCSTSGASTATSASVSGSPAPSDSEALLPELDGMGMGMGVHAHMHYAPMHAIGPYDMPFDGAHTHAYDMGMGLDAEMGMGLEHHHHHQHGHGYHLSAEMGVDAMLHAPGVGGKHAMSMGMSPQQETTPTATVFGGEVHHGQQEFESVFEDYGM